MTNTGNTTLTAVDVADHRCPKPVGGRPRAAPPRSRRARSSTTCTGDLHADPGRSWMPGTWSRTRLRRSANAAVRWSGDRRRFGHRLDRHHSGAEPGDHARQAVGHPDRNHRRLDDRHVHLRRHQRRQRHPQLAVGCDGHRWSACPRSPAPLTTLAPGASTTCSATYTLTQANVDSGHDGQHRHRNGYPAGRATAVTGTPTPTRSPASSPQPGDHSSTRQQQPATVRATPQGPTIAYSFFVTNTGNVTLHGGGRHRREDRPVGDHVPGRPRSPRAQRPPAPRPTRLTQADVDSGRASTTPPPSAGTPPTGT